VLKVTLINRIVPTLTLSMSLLIHFLLINRNIDPLHDGIFYSYAVAISDGYVMHKDIPSQYGPMVPWIISIFISVFGEVVLVNRVLGFLVLCAISILFHLILIRYISKKFSSYLVALWLLVATGISEVTSVRWPYSYSIWPTTLSIFAQLLFFYSIIKHLSESANNQAWSGKILFFTSGTAIALAIFSRLQGLLIFIACVGIIIYLTKRKRILPRYSTYFFAGAVVGVIPPMLFLLLQNAFVNYVEQTVFGAFRFANAWMGGTSVSLIWLKALMLSAGIGYLVFFVIFAIISPFKRASKLLRISNVIVIAALISGLSLSSKNLELPNNSSEPIYFWSVKVSQSLSHAFIWPIGTAFFVLLIWLTVGAIWPMQGFSLRIYSSLKLDVLLAIIMGIIAASHLYVNFGYIWNITPITLSSFVILLKSQPWRINDKSNHLLISIKSFICVGIIAYTSIAISGLSTPYIAHEYKSLKGAVRNYDYLQNFDSLMFQLQDVILRNETLFVGCENLYLIESLDPSAYSSKQKLLRSNVDNSKALFAEDIHRDSSIEVVVFCSSLYGIEQELRGFGWADSKKFKHDGVDSIIVLTSP